MVLARPDEWETVSIPLQFATLCGQEVFVRSYCLLDLCMDFLLGNMVFVSYAQFLAGHLISLAFILLCSSAAKANPGMILCG